MPPPITWPAPLDAASAERIRAAWTLDPAVVYLNHGSFGACPRAVLEQQQQLRARSERQPVQFYARDLQGLLDGARAALAGFVGADPEHLAFVPNATTAVNTVLRSLSLGPGDELLTTDHAYGACRNALDFTAEQTGARVVVAAVPFPIADPEQVTRAVLAAATKATKLCLLDHVTSPTGLVFPVEEIVGALAARGIDTLVDGAHAIGMLPLALDRLGAAYYTTNCHKWLCAPKGSALLYVRPDRQHSLRPLTISHGARLPAVGRSRFRLEMDWTGTDDPTPYLCAVESMGLVGGLLPGGWTAVQARNRALARGAQQVLCEALEITPPAPAAMLGALASVPLPPAAPAACGDLIFAHPLQVELLARHQVEVPLFTWPQAPGRLLRVSAQLYNEPRHYALLADALVEALAAERAR